MANTKIKDMTVGSPMKLVLGFAMPLLFGFLFQQLYSFVDAAIVGKVLGADMLAAVGSTGSLNFLILGFCNGMCAGMAIPIAQSFGAREETEMRRYLANIIYLCVVISIVMGVATALLCPWMLTVMNTEASIFDGALTYIQIIFAAIPVTVLYNMASGVLRSLGDSKTPVVFIAIASIVNIVLDLVLIIGFHMGVAGAAIATVISQLVSGIGCTMVIIRHFPILHLRKEDKAFRPRYALHLLGIGTPMGLQFSITAIGAVMLQWSVNGIPENTVAAVAAMSAGGKISMFFTCIFDALSTTMATFAGQNMGARKIDRISQGFHASATIGWIYCILSYIAIWLFGRQMLMLFLDATKDALVIDMAHHYLKLAGLFFVPLMFLNILRLSIQGMGFTQIAMMAGVFELVARGLVSLFIVPIYGYEGACFAHPTAWVAANFFLVPCYLQVMKKVKLRS